MNEFIVWDRENKKFVENLTDYYLDKDCLLWKEECSKYECDLIIATDCICFPHIGKKDINNKKIYANCSIVEFKHITTYGCSYIRQGYFTFDNDLCCYIIKCINEDLILIYACSVFSAITDIKIIDTIQENKLGLIK